MREAVAHLLACHGMSQQWACRVIDAGRKSARDRSTRDDDAGLREKLRDLAVQRRRFGSRRLDVLPRREGVMINRKPQRLYKEEGLACWPGRSRRRAVGTKAPAPVLALTHQRWNPDFVHDQHATLFISLAHARVEIAAWVKDYNRQRPHSSLGFLVPAAFVAELDKQRRAPLRYTGFATQPVVSNSLMHKTTARL